MTSPPHAESVHSSVVHRLNCWTKLIIFLVVVPVCGFVMPLPGTLALLLVFACVFLLARIPFRRFWKAAGLYMMGLLVAVLILSGLLLTGPFLERLGVAASFVLRLFVMLCFGVLFTLTTNPRELPSAFLRVGLPHRFGVTLLVAMRMVPLISQRVRTIIDSQRARGLRLNLADLFRRRRMGVVEAFIIPILNCTMKTSVHMSDTLISRGYDPHGKVTLPPDGWSFADALVMSAGLVFLLAVFLL